MPETRTSRAEGDFTRFVGARWPALVKTLVLLGCPPALAPDVATRALSRCRRDWVQICEHDDIDVVVHRALVDAWDERRHEPWWLDPLPPADPVWPAPDLSALDRLTPEVRAGLVLRRFAGLEPGQAEMIAGRAAGGPLPASPDGVALRSAGERLAVDAPPATRGMTASGPPGGLRRSVVVVTGLVVLAVVVGGTWWAGRGTDEAEPEPVTLDPVARVRSTNPAEVAWYADDVLHLETATYVLPALRDLAVLSTGAVYGDREGRVVHLADDGTRTLLGTKDPEAPLAASEPLGWVAWVDPAGEQPRLLVYSVAEARIIGELALPASESGPGDVPDTRPVAIDAGAVFFVTSEGASSWVPRGQAEGVVALDLPDLIDVSSKTRVFQLDSERIRMDQPFFNVTFDVPGRGGELDVYGNHALTRSPQDGTILVYETRSGELVDVRPPGQQHVVDVVLAPDGAITYITIDPDAFASREGVNDSNPVKGELVTCRLRDGACETLATLVLDSEAPILAR